VLKHECFQGVEFEDEQISVADGLLTVKPGFQWRSFSMGFHAPLVFFWAGAHGCYRQSVCLWSAMDHLTQSAQSRAFAVLAYLWR